MNILEQLQRQILEMTLEKVRQEERASRAIADRGELITERVKQAAEIQELPKFTDSRGSA